MDAVEVGSLLEDLGVTPTEERLHAAFAEFDSNGDGLVTLEEASHSFL
jgi:Ca2+-binding EF-hand superfamily protein